MRPHINLFSALQWSFFVVAGLLFISTVFFNINTSFWFSFSGQMVRFLVFTALFCLMACVVYYVCGNRILDFLQKRYAVVVYGTMSVVFALQLAYTWLIHSPLERDVRIITENAQAGGLDEFFIIEYFSLYPNNFLILFFFRFIHRALVLFNMDEYFNRVLVIVNIVFVNTAIVLTFHAVKMALGVFKAYVAWIFALLLFAFIPWLIVPYSDTMSMPFAIGAVFLYLKSINSDKSKKICYAVAIGVMAQIGFLLKPSSVIPVIAILLVQALTDFRLFRNRKKTEKRPAYVSRYITLCVVLGMITASMVWNSFVHSPTKPDG